MFKLPFKLNFKKQNKAAGFYTVDIGSHSIKALAFKYLDELSIVGAGKELLEPQAVRAGNIIDIEKTAEHLDNTIFKASEGLVDSPNQVIFGLGNEQAINFVTTLKVTRPVKTLVSEKDIESIKSKVFSSADQQAIELFYEKTGNSDTELKLITSHTVYAKLDGQIQEEILEKEAKTIEIAMYTCYAPKYHLDHLQEIAHLLNLEILAITSNAFGIVQTIKLKKDAKALDGIIIDVGHDTTDISVFFAGGIVATNSLEIAGHHFTRDLSRETGWSILESERKKHEFSFGDISEDEAARVENGLTNVINTWLAGVETTFNNFAGVKTFGPDVYITGGGTKLPLVQESLEVKPWTKSIPFKELPKFYKLLPENFNNAKDLTGNVEDRDFLSTKCLATVYLDIIRAYD